MINNIKQYWTRFALYTALILSILGLFFPTSISRLGALPVFNIFQVISPVGFGVAMSNGTSYGNLTASSTPTVKGITATSTIRLSSISSTGCAQFDSTGSLGSTGAACASSAAGKTIDMFGGVSIVNGTDTRAATTTSATTGNDLMIWAACSVDTSSARNLQLDVSMTGKGTTTLATAALGNVNFTVGSAMSGRYTASTTGNVYVAVNNSDGSGIAASCGKYNFTIIRSTN